MYVFMYVCMYVCMRTKSLPSVFDVHGDSRTDCEVADGSGFRQPAHLRYLQVHRIGGLICHDLR